MNDNLNLHKLGIRSDTRDNSPVYDFSDQDTSVSFDKFEVVLRNQERRLLALIDEYKDGAIFGCVAWLTSVPILRALAKCNNVQIIVQKEDFLRPDLNNGASKRRNNNQMLRVLYNDLRCQYDRLQMRSPIRELSVLSGDPSVDAVRCLGNYNSSKIPAFPRMHHKFLVFCRIDKSIGQGANYLPVAVWTGSFNLTYNATMSFENNICMTDYSGQNKFIHAYLFEHHQLFALTEPLNWEHEWCAPEYRIGT